jgi:hypothetical protein
MGIEIYSNVSEFFKDQPLSELSRISTLYIHLTWSSAFVLAHTQGGSSRGLDTTLGGA